MIIGYENDASLIFEVHNCILMLYSPLRSILSATFCFGKITFTSLELLQIILHPLLLLNLAGNLP